MVIDTENFQHDVIEQSFSKPVLVDFWAEWCGPCKILGPILERLAEKYSDRFTLVKLNTDLYQEIAMKYGIRGIPNVKLFVDGEVKGEFTGALPAPQVEDWIKKNIPGKDEKVIEYVRQLISSGKEDEAYKVLNELKKEDKDNKETDVLLAQVLLFRNPDEALALLNGAGEETDNYELVNSVQTIATLLKNFESGTFPEGSVKDDYKKAAGFLKEKNFDKALEEFINIIRNDRSYDDDGARKACIAIFKYLGEENPLTLKHRRDFGSALYV
jgi:putative thioredoxin